MVQPDDRGNIRRGLGCNVQLRRRLGHVVSQRLMRQLPTENIVIFIVIHFKDVKHFYNIRDVESKMSTLF